MSNKLNLSEILISLFLVRLFNVIGLLQYDGCCNSVAFDNNKQQLWWKCSDLFWTITASWY